jgi:hypothetical protein
MRGARTARCPCRRASGSCVAWMRGAPYVQCAGAAIEGRHRFADAGEGRTHKDGPHYRANTDLDGADTKISPR